jgi:hypothetical protein
MNTRTADTHRQLALALTICVLLATSGCGHDTSEDPGKGTADGPTRAEYIERADAICDKGNAELETAATEFFEDKPEPTPQQEHTFATTIFVPNLRAQIAELRELEAPEGDEDEVTAIWDAASSGLDEIAADPSPFDGAPPAGVQDAGRLAAQYGFKICGST